MVVSWASAGQAARPRVRIGQRVIAAAERAYTDALSGTVVWTYHARVDGLRPGATYGYAVTADNDSSAADPFSATFSTAPAGRARFRFTSFGDLATPNPAWASSYGQAAYAVGAVETFQPLFHLVNGDLAYADLTPAAQPQVWRDFGNNVQASAANRPWMPVPGNHELELGNGAHGLASYLTRYTLPSNGVDGLDGRWYAFRVGTVLFVCLSGDDVAYQDGGGFVAGPGSAGAGAGNGHPPLAAGTSRLRARLLGRRADPVARVDPGGRPRRRVDRLDRGAAAPVRLLVGTRRQRFRPGGAPGMAAAFRPLRGRPRAVRARPRIRAVLPGPRL